MGAKVLVITVNYNGKIYLKSFLKSLKKVNYKNLEIILVDNDSTDGSLEYVKKKYPEVQIIKNDSNLGFVLSNNMAVEKSNAEYIFFLNNDTKIEKNTILKLVEVMEKDKNIGVCGCQIYSYDRKNSFHIGIGIDIFGYPVDSNKIFYIEGSALMVRKKIFKEIDGFDSQYFMFHEDIDLCWRIWLYGYKIVVEKEAIVYHFGGGSSGGKLLDSGIYTSTIFRRYLSERNNIRTLIKNYSLIYLLIILPFYLLINLVEILFFFITFKFNVAQCYLRAYKWNLINFKNTLMLRSIIQKKRKISDKELMKRMYLGSGKLQMLKKIKIPIFK